MFGRVSDIATALRIFLSDLTVPTVRTGVTTGSGNRAAQAKDGTGKRGALCPALQRSLTTPSLSPSRLTPSEWSTS
jgi:hypothetical protein